MNSPFLTNLIAQRSSPLVNAEGSVAYYPSPQSVSDKSAAIAKNENSTGGSAPQTRK